jgi:hypothetical protein
MSAGGANAFEVGDGVVPRTVVRGVSVERDGEFARRVAQGHAADAPRRSIALRLR